jgi:hypothetical protein
VTALEVVVKSLACWRLAYMLVKEAGPGKVFQTTRRTLGVEAEDEQGRITHSSEHPVFGMFGCVFCMSIWSAALVTHSVRPVKVLAVSAGALIIDRWIQS